MKRKAAFLSHVVAVDLQPTPQQGQIKTAPDGSQIRDTMHRVLLHVEYVSDKLQPLQCSTNRLKHDTN